MNVLFLVRRVGPYHDARYEAAGRLMGLHVVETRSDSQEYPWSTAAGARHYKLGSFGRAPDPEVGLRGAALHAALEQVLAERRPQVVACTGWADPEYHAALNLCRAKRIPVVLMSDSTREDESRHWWKEALKRPLVRSYSAAIVAGTRSRAYLESLGFPPKAVFAPWDVVDNGYFARPEPTVDGGGCRPYFLCISRYIPKKNLFRLIQAYGAYRGKHGAGSWDLVLLGSGELEDELNVAVTAAGLDAYVKRPGFVQYGELPPYYHGAGACILTSLSDQWGLAINEAMAAEVPVLVSVACGCCPDLVVEGETGFPFDPNRIGTITDALYKIATLPEPDRRRMGRNCRAKISEYSPERFAEALAAAAAYALEHPATIGWGSRIALRVLAKRG